MKKSRLILIIALVGLLMAGAGGGAAWWFTKRAGPSAAPAKPVYDKKLYKYVSLEKVIVMLRNRAGDPMSHYLAVDLVFKAEAEKERTVKEHLPLLRSVAVSALSVYPLDKAQGMTIDQLAADLNAAFQANYEKDNHEKPFIEAMIGKLIIE